MVSSKLSGMERKSVNFYELSSRQEYVKYILQFTVEGYKIVCYETVEIFIQFFRVQ